jgi:hypothetical protein
MNHRGFRPTRLFILLLAGAGLLLIMIGCTRAAAPELVSAPGP